MKGNLCYNLSEIANHLNTRGEFSTSF